MQHLFPDGRDTSPKGISISGAQVAGAFISLGEPRLAGEPAPVVFAVPPPLAYRKNL
jgi:hypothetical protein